MSLLLGWIRRASPADGDAAAVIRAFMTALGRLAEDGGAVPDNAPETRR